MTEGDVSRRTFLKRSGQLAAAAAAANLAADLLAAEAMPAASTGLAGTRPTNSADVKPVAAPTSSAAPAKPAEAMPTIKLGNLEVSRLILGSNPFWGYAHKPGKLGEEMKAWHTDERIAGILDEAAANGVTAAASPPGARWIEVFKRYLDKGGKLRIWIAQPDGPPEQMQDEITLAVKSGARAVFVQGERVEEQFLRKKFDVLKGWVEHIKSLGVPAGLAAHKPEIHPELESRGFPTDFYYQCLFNVTNGEQFRMVEREAAVETIRKLDKKPVIAYKILGAGRIPAAEGFEYAFERIRRKDGVCVGVYTKDAVDQIRENAILTSMLTKA
jgi:hypothetical protein